jgi:hypothetical protein
MQPEVTDINETLMQFLYRAPIGLVQTTLDGTIEMINPMSAALLMPVSRSGGLDNLFDALQEVAPQLRDLVAAFPQPLGPICEALRIPLDSGGTDATLQVLSLSLMKLDAGRLMAVLLDVTLEVEREQTAMARQLDAAARVDALTRMPNRTAVLEQLAQGMTRARTDTGDQFAVLFMNCDRLKQINDTLGHAAGDEVLSRMADRLRTTLRGRRRETGRPRRRRRVRDRARRPQASRRRAHRCAAPAGCAGQALRDRRPAAALQRQHGHRAARPDGRRRRRGAARRQHRDGRGQASRRRALRGL